MKYLKGMLLASVMMMLVACGGGGGSSDGTGDTTESVEVKTTIELSGTDSGVVYDRAGRATAVTVTLTLADGTAYTMTDNGNGEYACTVENYSDDSVGYVEAHAGDIILKNFFSSLTSDEGSVDIGATDPESTLFVDVLQAYVGALEQNGNSASADVLLAGIANATLDINVAQFKQSVENDSEYESLRQTYTTQLSWENASSGADISGVLASALESSEIYEEIQTGGLVVPGSSNDAVSASEIAEEMFSIYASGELSQFATVIGPDFLNDGYDTEAWLADMQQELTEMETYGATMNVVSSNATAVKVDATTYKVFIAAHTQILMDGEVYEEESFDDAKDFSYKVSPMLVTYNADSDKWTLSGNQRKSEFWMNVGFYERADGSFERRFWADVEETDLYPIDSVTLDAGFLSEPVELLINSNDDSNEYHFYSAESSPYYYTGGSEYSASWLGSICSSAYNEVSLEAVYTDGSTDGIEVTLPSCPTQAVIDEFIPEISATVNTDGSVTLAFSHTDSTRVDEINLDVYTADYGNDVFEADSIPFDETEIVVPSNTFTPGQTYNINFEVFDQTGRVFGKEISFTYPAI